MGKILNLELCISLVWKMNIEIYRIQFKLESFGAQKTIICCLLSVVSLNVFKTHLEKRKWKLVLGRRSTEKLSLSRHIRSDKILNNRMKIALMTLPR